MNVDAIPVATAAMLIRRPVMVEWTFTSFHFPRLLPLRFPVRFAQGLQALGNDDPPAVSRGPGGNGLKQSRVVSCRNHDADGIVRAPPPH